MELALFVYLAEVVGSVSILFGIISFIGALAVFTCIIVFSAECKMKNFKSWWITPVICCAVVSALIPSKETMYMMAGAYAAQTVATSSVASKTLELIESKIDSELNNLKKKEK